MSDIVWRYPRRRSPVDEGSAGKPRRYWSPNAGRKYLVEEWQGPDLTTYVRLLAVARQRKEDRPARADPSERPSWRPRSKPLTIRPGEDLRSAVWAATGLCFSTCAPDCEFEHLGPRQSVSMSASRHTSETGHTVVSMSVPLPAPPLQRTMLRVGQGRRQACDLIHECGLTCVGCGGSLYLAETTSRRSNSAGDGEVSGTGDDEADDLELFEGGVGCGECMVFTPLRDLEAPDATRVRRAGATWGYLWPAT
jgi:hypothetical protein